LISVLFLTGCFLKRVDCGEVVDSVLYDKGRGHLSRYEREVRQRVVDVMERWELTSWEYLHDVCEADGYWYMGEEGKSIEIPDDHPDAEVWKKYGSP